MQVNQPITPPQDKPYTFTIPGDVEQIRADRVCAADTVWFPEVCVGWLSGWVRVIDYTGEDVQITIATKYGARISETSRNNMVWITKRG